MQGPGVVNVYINYEKKFAFVEFRTGVHLPYVLMFQHGSSLWTLWVVFPSLPHQLLYRWCFCLPLGEHWPVAAVS